MRKVHLFLVLLTLLSLSGCTGRRKRKPNRSSSIMELHPPSSTTVSVETKERTEPNPPMLARGSRAVKLKKGNTEAGGRKHCHLQSRSKHIERI